MIVAINYSQDGSRYIANITFKSNRTRQEIQDLAHYMTQDYDEVYVISSLNFNNNDQNFINEIVTKGCRMV